VANAVSTIDLKNAYKVRSENMMGRLEGLGADGRIILKWFSKSRPGRYGLDSFG
jgi:hypothetical protein